jgi:hypothetical protein
MFFPAADTIAFAEGGAEAMRITDAGQLWIGTTTSVERLAVNGNALVGGFVGRSYQATITTASTGIEISGTVPGRYPTLNLWNVSGSGSISGQLGLYASNGQGVIYQNGYIRCLPTYIGGTGGTVSGAIAFGTYDGSTSLTEKMRITPTGNVAIGQTTASQALDVNGDVVAKNIFNPFFLAGL